VRARLLALLALALGAAGCLDPIVGARCADGYVPCHGRCVVICTADGGGPADGPDGSGPAQGPDGATGDGATGDGATGDGGGGSDGGGPSGATDAALDGGGAGSDAATGGDGSTLDGGSATDGGATTDANGAGGAPGGDARTGTTDGAALGDALSGASDAPSPADAGLLDGTMADAADGAVDAAATDALTTDALAPDMLNCGALTACPAGCVDLQSDPDNCGSCNFSCGTGLCVSGKCELRQAGHLVVIGHDYAVSRPSMDNLVGNAVFLAPGTNVKVLAYHGDSSLEEVNGTDAAINRVAASVGRTWIKTVVPAADVPSSLAFADVFVIYAQANATDAGLLFLGNSWATALSDFVQAGKTIVVLEGSYPNSGTYQIVQQANLFHATGRMDATGQTLLVGRAGDAVATRVPQTFRGERSTVWFATMDQTVVVQVATDAGTQPVVIHLVF
jgi:hypothetical protein